ncbi:hypothetical protein CPB86DRAFT_101508 [Serendipita vermifera]|nr:hypothetical protein CPB86DRAFT_101508 [Serendipita vermifera]
MNVWPRSNTAWECRGRDIKLNYDGFIRDWGVLYGKCITDGCTENAAALIGHLEK